MPGPLDDSKIQSGIHWRAPVVMIASLFVGTALAVGHHAFYASLAGSAVSSDPIKVVGWTTTQQQVNIAIGTAFAFVVKASLILACSTAYIQVLFKAINHTNFKLSTLDNWFAGLNDLWSLGCLASYWRYPLLTLVALTCWLLPIAAIISPASLSVVFDQIHPSPMLQVAVRQPAFDSMAFTTYYFLPEDNGSQGFSREGPTNEVSRIARAVASGGEILSIDPPGTNSTWELEQSSLRFVCNDFEPDLLRDVKSNLMDVLNNYTSNGTWPSIHDYMFSYLSWVKLANDTSPMPFTWLSLTEGWALQEEMPPYFVEMGTDLFVVIVPRADLSFLLPSGEHPIDRPLNLSDVRDSPQEIAEDKRILMEWYFETAMTLRCRAVPTTYQLRFTYGGSQDQRIQILSATDANDLNSNITAFYSNSHSGQLSLFDDSEVDTGNISSHIPELLRLSSWASVQQAAMDLLTGASNTVPQSEGQASMSMWKGPSWRSQTQVFTTILGSRTKEMHDLGQGRSTGYNMTLKDSGVAFDQAVSILPATTDRPLRSFKDTFEELFFNMTISMASSESLNYNSSSPFAPPPANVTFNVFGNVYSYGSDKLWLAYGIAIGVTFLNVLIGLWAIVQNGASFTDNFSTVIRVAKNAVIDANMSETSMSGKDPLPKSLAKAELRLWEGEGLLESKHHGSVESVHHVVGYAPPRMDSRGWKSYDL